MTSVFALSKRAHHATRCTPDRPPTLSKLTNDIYPKCPSLWDILYAEYRQCHKGAFHRTLDSGPVVKLLQQPEEEIMKEIKLQSKSTMLWVTQDSRIINPYNTQS